MAAVANENNKNKAGFVNNNGNINNNNVNNTGVGVSPAFNVNLSSVIFSSVISSESPNHYKLSLLDKDLEISL